MNDASANARTLLIVDDDATFRTRLVRAFESRGLSVRAPIDRCGCSTSAAPHDKSLTEELHGEGCVEQVA